MKIVIKTFYFCLILAFVLVVAGCQSIDGKSGLVSKEGVKAESLMPKNSFVVMKLGTDDLQQIENLKKLSENFPIEGMDIAMEEMINELRDNLSEEGLSLEEDLYPAIGENPQMMMSMVLAENSSDDPDMLAVLVLGDADKVEKFIKIPSGEEAKFQPYKGYEIYNTGSDNSYLLRFKDVFLFSNKLEVVKEAVDRSGNGADSLLANTNYQKGIKDLPGVWAYFYIDIATIMKQMQNDPETRDAFEKIYGEDSGIMDIMNIIESELFAFTAEEDGLGMHGYVFGDADKWNEYKYMNVEIDPAYMYKMLPGDSVIMFMESGHLRTSIEVLEKMYANMPEFEEGMKTMKTGLSNIGLDYENDIMAFLDKGYAVSIYDNGGVIPSMMIAFDASGHTEGANKLMDVINKGFDAMVTNIPEEAKGIFENRIVNEGENKAYTLSLDMNSMPKEQMTNYPEGLERKFSLDYGVTTDNVAYFAYYPGFSSGDFGTLADNEDFKKDIEYIKGYDRSLMYFNIENLMSYVDHIVQFSREQSGGEAGPSMQEYELAKKYISPFKSFIMAAKIPKEGFAEMRGFIRIEK